MLWVGFVVLFHLFRAIRTDSLSFTWETFLFELIPFTGVASSVYINLRILLPRFLVPKKYGRYAIAILIVTAINATVVFFLFEMFRPLLQELADHPHPSRWLFFPSFMMLQVTFMIITSFIHYVRENNRLNEIALSVTEIESNRLRAELNSLKAQINPHFLFNTLNNIYSYSLFKSEKTPDMILKLSNLMNYIIYECQADRVALEKEIEFMQDYIDLEKLRVEDSVDIKIELPEINSDYQIAPLLFVPLLENAFKHGMSISGQQPYIHFKMIIDAKDTLCFSCENLMDEEHPDDLPDKQGGIGLENVKKRLELLYPGNHEFAIDKKDQKYKVNLMIHLGVSEG